MFGCRLTFSDGPLYLSSFLQTEGNLEVSSSNFFFLFFLLFWEQIQGLPTKERLLQVL
jgi:hypothetical protein